MMPPVPRSQEQEQKQDIFQSWLAECEELHERMVEALLDQIEPKPAHPPGS